MSLMVCIALLTPASAVEQLETLVCARTPKLAVVTATLLEWRFVCAVAVFFSVAIAICTYSDMIMVFFQNLPAIEHPDAKWFGISGPICRV